MIRQNKRNMDRKIKKFALLLMLLPVILHAQTLQVKEAYMAGSDITGSQYARTTSDGKACALVKVRLPQHGVTFEGPIVGDIKEDAGEYWVFLPANCTHLTVRHKTFGELLLDFEALKFAPLQPKVTYVAVITAKAGNKSKHPFTLKVTPASAAVLIDSEVKPLENGVVTVTLEEGTHEYVVTAEGYEMQTGSFDVAASGEKSLSIRLSEASPTSLTPEEQFQIGQEYLTGSNSRQRDIPKAINYLLAASDSGHTGAQYLLATIYKLGPADIRDYAKSFELFQKTAASGLEDAQYQLADNYLNGWGTDKDTKKGIKMLHSLAEKGNVMSLLKLASCYLKGDEVKKNIKKGVSCLEKAAAQGNATALYVLGDGYITGKFGKKDAYKATQYLVKGLELHDVDCAKRLGKIYLKGEGGVREDLMKAAKLANMAKAFEKEKKSK